jgi:hypothetical protein
MIEQPFADSHKGFTVEGIAEPTFGQKSEWVARSRVLLRIRPDSPSVSNTRRLVLGSRHCLPRSVSFFCSACTTLLRHRCQSKIWRFPPSRSEMEGIYWQTRKFSTFKGATRFSCCWPAFIFEYVNFARLSAIYSDDNG